MKNVTMWFLLVVFHVFVIREVMLECHPKKKFLMEKYDWITEEFLIWRGLVESKTECVKSCYRDVRCITFQYTGNGSCNKYAADIDTWEWETDAGFGHVTYQMQGRGGFGEECMSNEGCHFLKSECRQNTCGCIIGYNFNPMENACSNGCTVYGKSYGTFPGTSLAGMDVDSEIGGSLEECRNLCSSVINCKSFDYVQNLEKCFLKWGGMVDNPTRIEIKSHVSHEVRNCYN